MANSEPWPIVPHVSPPFPGFNALVARTSLNFVPTSLSPWHVIVYFDQLTPGNVLRPDNKRKAYLIYFTVTEFGDIIRHENAWLPIGILRHSVP